MTPYLICSDVIKIYSLYETTNTVTALRGVSLKLEKGSLNSIIGPSGSGKTTLMRIISGFDRPTAGTVQVGDDLLNHLSPSALEDYRRKEVGFVGQLPDQNLILTLSVQRNLEVVMRISGMPREKIKQRAVELLRMVGVSHRIHHPAGKLSGGESQRVSIALALANDPALLLADEPTGELDSVTTEKIVELFKTLNREVGTTIIISTHDHRVARICDSYRLINGRIASVSFGSSQQFESTFGEDELLTIDNLGLLKMDRSDLEKIGSPEFGRVRYNPEKGCLEVFPPARMIPVPEWSRKQREGGSSP